MNHVLGVGLGDGSVAMLAGFDADETCFVGENGGACCVWGGVGRCVTGWEGRILYSYQSQPTSS